MVRANPTRARGPRRLLLGAFGAALFSLAILLWIEVASSSEMAGPMASPQTAERPSATAGTGEPPERAAAASSDVAGRHRVDPGFDPSPLSNARFRLGLLTFVGRVLDVRGAPMQGVHLEVTHAHHDDVVMLGTPHEVVTRVTAVTDAEGRFETGGLWPRRSGVDMWKVGLLQPETGAREVRIERVSSQPFGGRVDLGDLAWYAEHRLHGRVLDAVGAPVVGARVTARLSDGMGFWRLHPSTVEAPQLTPARAKCVVREDGLREVITGADGTFELIGLAARPHFVDVSMIGETFVRAVRRSVLPEDLGDIVLSDRLVSGRVVDAATGAPLAAAEVMVDVESTLVPGAGQRLTPLGATDAAGRFRFALVHAGSELPTRFATRRGPGHRWVPHSDCDTSREIVLDHPSDLGIDVRVVDASGAVLDAGYELILAPADTPTVRAMSRPFPTWADLELDVAKLARRLDDGTWRIEGLARGVYWIASLGGGHSGFAKFDLRDGADVNIELQHTRLPTRVHVRGPHGEPISHAQVITAPRQLGEGGALRLSGTTDADGQVDVWPLCDEEFVLTVRHPRLGDESRRLPIGTERTEVRLPGIGHVRGTLFLFGVECSEPPFGIVVRRGSGDSMLGPKIQFGADGRFWLGMIPAGPYVIEAVQHTLVERWSITPDHFDVSHGATLDLEIRIDALPGEDTRGHATLRGKVDARGIDASSLTVSVGDDRHQVVSAVVEDGRYQLERVPTGTRRVELLAEQRVLIAQNVQLLPGAFVDLDFDGEWGSIRCEIEADPRDLLAYRLGLRNVGSACFAGPPTMSAIGASTWRGLDFGEHVIDVFEPGGRVVSSQAVSIDANAPHASIRIALAARFAVKWTVAPELLGELDSCSLRFVGPENGTIRGVRGIGFCRVDPLPPGEYRVFLTMSRQKPPLLARYESKQPIVVGSGVSELELDLVETATGW